jgi:hypothetical protein
MPLAKEVAIELRKLADALDQEPDAELPRTNVSFYCETKAQFIGSVQSIPRPLVKSEDRDDDRWKRIRVAHETPALHIDASVLKSLTCELVTPARPAVYRCDPILSLEEDAALTEPVVA